MGIVAENLIRVQLVKGQGETNQRLDALIKEQRALIEQQQLTNQWLARIAQLLEAQQQPQRQRPAEGPPRGSWQVR